MAALKRLVEPHANPRLDGRPGCLQKSLADEPFVFWIVRLFHAWRYHGNVLRSAVVHGTPAKSVSGNDVTASDSDTSFMALLVMIGVLEVGRLDGG